MSWLGKMVGIKGAGTSAASGRGGALVAGARVVIGRQDYGLADLGVRTFRIQPYSGDLIERQNFSFSLTVTVDNEDFSCTALGLVREISDKGGLLAQFAAPQPAFDKKLMEFLAHRKLGQRTGKGGKR